MIDSSTIRTSSSFDITTNQIEGTFRANFDLERDGIRPRFRLNPESVINIRDEDFCEAIKKSMSTKIAEIREEYKRKKNVKNWDVVVGSIEPSVKDGVIYFNITKQNFMLDLDAIQSKDFFKRLKEVVKTEVEQRIEQEVDAFASLIDSSKSEGWRIVNRLMIEQEAVQCLNMLNIGKYNLG